MQKKHNALFLILGIIALVFTAYALFATVYNQIIIQNEGFFYALVFGGILILVYIFVNIVIKLMNISENVRYSKAFEITCICAAFALCIIFAVWRLSFHSTVSINESDIYKAATLINNDSLSVSRDMTDLMLNNPSKFGLSFIYSLFFNIIPSVSNISVIINVIFSCISAILCFFIARKLTDSVCGILAVFSILFLPSNMYAIYSVSPECMTSAVFFAAMWALTLLLDVDEKGKIILYSILYGVFMGLICFNEPAYLIVVLLMPIVLIGTYRKNRKFVVVASLIAIAVTAVMFLFKSSVMDITYVEIIKNFFKCFNPFKDIKSGALKSFNDIKDVFESGIGANEKNIEDNAAFLLDIHNKPVSHLTSSWQILMNQLMYMYFLILTISAILSFIQNKDKRLTHIIFLTVVSTFVVFIQTNRAVDTYYYHTIFALISSVGYFYMYLNHHPEDKFVFSKVYNINIYESEQEKRRELEAYEQSEEERELERQQFILRANALIFSDDNTALYGMIKAEERANYVVPDNHYIDDDLEEVIIAPVSETPKQIDDVFETVYEPEIVGPSESVSNQGMMEPEEIKENDKPVTYIHNPLPVPVRKPHQRLDFDHSVDEEDDFDFDINDSKLLDFDV